MTSRGARDGAPRRGGEAEAFRRVHGGRAEALVPSGPPEGERLGRPVSVPGHVSPSEDGNPGDGRPLPSVKNKINRRHPPGSRGQCALLEQRCAEEPQSITRFTSAASTAFFRAGSSERQCCMHASRCFRMCGRASISWTAVRLARRGHSRGDREESRVIE